MKKQIEKILTELKDCEYYTSDKNMIRIDQATSALIDLFKEKMLEYVGEDKCQHKEYFTAVAEAFDDGYNQAKAEIRKKVMGL